GGDGRVRDAEFSPDGSLVVTADGSDARLFETDGTGSGTHGRRLHAGAADVLVEVLPTGSALRVASFSHDGRTIVTAGSDGRALLWDVGSGKVRATLAQSGQVLDAVFSPDDRLVATTGTGRTAKVWDTASGSLLLTLTHPAAVLGAAFSPDG